MDYRSQQINSVKNRTESSASRNPKLSVPKKPVAVAKGHDAILKKLQDNGTVFTIHFLNGDYVAGKLIARDKFTITIQPAEAGSLPETFFKHAMLSFHEGE